MEIFGSTLIILSKLIPNTVDKAGNFALLGGIGIAGIVVSGTIYVVMSKKNKKK